MESSPASPDKQAKDGVIARELNSYFTEDNDQEILYTTMATAFKNTGMCFLDNKSIVRNMMLIATKDVAFDDYLKSSFSLKMMKLVFQSKAYSRKRVRGIWLMCRYLGELEVCKDNYEGRCKATFKTMLQPGMKVIDTNDYAMMLYNQMRPHINDSGDLSPPTEGQCLGVADETFSSLFNGNIEKEMTFQDYLVIMKESQQMKPLSACMESMRQKANVSFQRKGSMYQKSPSSSKKE